MWIVRLALHRPYTFIVMALLILVLGVVTIVQIPTDILPEINIPVVSVIWSYNGITPKDMAQRIVTISERAATTTVGNIQHIESESLPGVAVVRFYFQPGTNIGDAIAQINAISETILRITPPGTSAPLIIKYDASSVPILQLGVGSDVLSQSTLYDLGLNFIRTQLATVRGASIPLPYGGKPKEIVVNLDLPALRAYGLTPLDVSNAINAQNLISPTGDIRLGSRDVNVLLNQSPPDMTLFNQIPIKAVNGAVVTIGDVANVHSGSATQTNIVRQNGRPSTLLTILKNGDASTLSVVSQIKAALPAVRATLPKSVKLEPLFDQSVFVRAAVNDVIQEGLIAACLTAAMILLFLGSWRSTFIVAVSIPLSILSSIIILGFLGQTLNIMTLGGLALAVGILVDDATVTIENIHHNIGSGKSLQKAILDGAQQIATPTLVSTLCICIVFVAVVFLNGPAKFLFTPLALAVVFAMLASYILSRTLVPVLIHYLLRHEMHLYREHVDGSLTVSGDLAWRIHRVFQVRFERFRSWYFKILTGALHHRPLTISLFGIFFLLSLAVIPFVGENFFPNVDAGQFRLHVRAPAGTRLQQTAAIFTQVEDTIRKVVGPNHVGLVIDNIGLPASGIDLAFGDSATIGPSDGEILVSLKGNHMPTSEIQSRLRTVLHHEYPQDIFFFQPADIVNQILNFGVPAPIDVQVVGRSPNNYSIAQKIAAAIKKVPGAVDVYVSQVLDAPALKVDVNRTKAAELGLTQSQVASNMLISLSGSGQTAPNFWLDPKNGVNYQVAVFAPTYKVDSLQSLLHLPIGGGVNSQELTNVATLSQTVTPQVVNHYNIQPVYDVYASVQGRDLGSVSRQINGILAHMHKSLPRGSSLMVRGQVQSMNESFLGLGEGIVFAILIVYLLMVVNFQSWIDPLIIISALPGALCGILWMLYLTQTTFSVPSLMGSIMCIGVATANSILVVTFANDRRHLGDNAFEAALAAGHTRLRPVIMTAFAMIIGMVPMAIGFGAGGEQNAPLGRAVIGGLLVATFTTLIFVPVVYSLLRKSQPHTVEEELYEEEETSTPPNMA